MTFRLCERDYREENNSSYCKGWKGRFGNLQPRFGSYIFLFDLCLVKIKHEGRLTPASTIQEDREEITGIPPEVKPWGQLLFPL